MTDKHHQFSSIVEEFKSTLKLNLDYAKLTAAEKLTLLLTAVAFFLFAFVFISLIMFFLSLAIVRCIATGVGLIWAYFIMCAFYIIVFSVVAIFRKQLIINPISRFVSRLFLNP